MYQLLWSELYPPGVGGVDEGEWSPSSVPFLRPPSPDKEANAAADLTRLLITLIFTRPLLGGSSVCVVWGFMVDLVVGSSISVDILVWEREGESWNDCWWMGWVEWSRGRVWWCICKETKRDECDTMQTQKLGREDLWVVV